METPKLQKMLTDAASVITKQGERISLLEKNNKAYESDNASLREKIASYQRKEECEKLTDILIEKGVVNPTDFRVKVAELHKGKEDIGMLIKSAEYFVPSSTNIEFVDNGESGAAKTADEIAERRFSSMSY